MATIKFTYQGKTKDVYQNDSFIEDYSEDPEALGKIVRELADLSCDLSLDTAPWDGKTHLKSKVIVGYRGRGYRGRAVRFDFYHSIADTKEFLSEHMWYPGKGNRRIKARGLDSEFLKDVLYDLLCTIRCNAGIHELNYDEFCDQCGYDEDSRKAHSLYEQCCGFSRDIARVFNDEEIESFPS